MAVHKEKGIVDMYIGIFLTEDDVAGGDGIDPGSLGDLS